MGGVSVMFAKKIIRGGHQIDFSDYFTIAQITDTIITVKLANVRIISDIVIKSCIRNYNSRIKMIIFSVHTSTLWLCWGQMIIARYQEFLGEGIW